MEHVEVEGSTIDEAIGRALQKLGVERERVAIEILSDASRGLFGLGRRKAKVRATLRAPLRIEPDSPLPDAPATAMREMPGNERRTTQQPDTRAARPTPSAKKPRPETPIDAASLEKARAVLGEVVQRMGLDATVEVSQTDDGQGLSLKGDASGILIGRRGQTLDALEYVVNRIAVRSEEAPARISVDSENYRSRHRRSLEDLAQRMAEQARRRRKAVTLNAMSPRDRRIVHLALQGDASLTTRSTGSGFYRKLLIIPSGSTRQRPKERPRSSAKAPTEGADGR